MSPTTTLITFRVRAPPSTRTLQLYGSWDNFTRGYPMSKDLQSGSEYWSGCFNFTNIICDGRPSDHMRPRDGGLRMGGTYWYHYKINDETDFHNVCERATTNCPMMPGQLINVLNIPYAFSGNRSRNPSTSSTSSERRTMDPEDRFMNPRPAPAKPEMFRINTSPTLNDFPDVEDTSNASIPASQPLLRLPKKPSLDSFATTGGLKAAFLIRTARSQSPEAKNVVDGESHKNVTSYERPTTSRGQSSERDGRPTKGLLLRSASEDIVPILSFEEHRRQRSHSREHSSLRNAVPVEPYPQVEPLVLLRSSHEPLGTVKEVVSDSITPIDTSSSEAIPNKAEPDLEKRLPTLPNTPSSAYPPSLLEVSPPRRPLDLDQLQSHFSATTIDTEYQPISMVFGEKSHFSAWTMSTGAASIIVDSSVPLPEFQAHPPVKDREAHGINLETEAYLPSCLSFSSISSSISTSISTTPSTSFFDTDTEFEAAQIGATSVFRKLPNQVLHYSLPEDDYASQITLKAASQEPPRGRSREPAFLAYGEATNTQAAETEIIHSECMQRLLDELSYLSEMIQQ